MGRGAGHPEPYTGPQPVTNEFEGECRRCKKWSPVGDLGDGLCIACWDNRASGNGEISVSQVTPKKGRPYYATGGYGPRKVAEAAV